jgi:aldehyde dehydrogenase (NAD+)
LDPALRGVAFVAMGTAGQRCTSLRRLFIHDSVCDEFIARLNKAYEPVSVGNPLAGNLVGLLIDVTAYEAMQKSLGVAKAAGASIFGSDRVAFAGADEAYYVKPTLVEIDSQTGPAKSETFAPILFVMKYTDQATVVRTSVQLLISLSILPATITVGQYSQKPVVVVPDTETGSDYQRYLKISFS